MTAPAARGDVLDAVLSAGLSLGIARARAMLSGRAHEDFTDAIARTLTFADEVAAWDPVAGRVIREAAYKVLHGDDVIEATARDVVGAHELVSGPPAAGGATLPALPMWQPHADLVVRGHKRIETRSWAAPDELIGRPIAIYATKGGPTVREMAAMLAHPSFRTVLGPKPKLSRGGVVGLVTVTRCERMTPVSIEAVDVHERAFGHYERGRYAWHLTGAHHFPEPKAATWPAGSRARWFDWPVPPPCGRILVGRGGDTSDPLCALDAGHDGPCMP
jgi:hypothetical protein